MKNALILIVVIVNLNAEGATLFFNKRKDIINLIQLIVL